MAGSFVTYTRMRSHQLSHVTPLHLRTITLFGDYGTAKTSIALGNDKARYYDLEDGKPDAFRDAPAFTESDGKTPIPRTWAAFAARIREIWAGDTTMDGLTLVIDPVTELWNLCERHGLAARKITKMPRDDYGNTLKEIRAEFEEVFNILLMLRTKRRMGTVFIAHEDIEEIETDTQTIRSARPKVSDKHVKTLIGAKPQLVLRTFVVDEHPTTLKPFDEPQFLILTKRMTAQDKVKDRTGLLPKFVKASWSSLASAYEAAQASTEAPLRTSQTKITEAV